ncbi:hypothetical protein KKH43_02815 [Patescibacteria group bacterium]|nr:hypothetical protein [Patescibacteria group bacterium]
MKNSLVKHAKDVAKQKGFAINKLLYQADYYTKDHPRNVIYDGIYQGNKAVLKVYSDPRVTDEPISLTAFNKANKSTILKAPAVFAYEIESPHTGWMIVEQLPEGGHFFKTPLSLQSRDEFLSVYKEYKKNFPKKPTRPLRLAEYLPAEEFHHARIIRWFELAHNKEAASKEQVLAPSEFIPRYLKALSLIEREFKGRKMEWIHGHFKPAELYKASNNTYYLLDFAHTHLFPEGYELAFMIWAELLKQGADYKKSYSEWRESIFEWVLVLEPIAKELGIKRYSDYMRAALTERTLGTLLADVTATDEKPHSKKEKIARLYHLLDDLS